MGSSKTQVKTRKKKTEDPRNSPPELEGSPMRLAFSNQSRLESEKGLQGFLTGKEKALPNKR